MHDGQAYNKRCRSKKKSNRLKILCIQLKQLGDVLTTTPAVRALAQHYPGCEIDFLTQKPAHTVYQHSPYVQHVYCVRWELKELFPLLRKIYRRKYDLLVDFSGSSKTAVFSRLTHIPRRIGIDSENRNWCFTDTLAVTRHRAYAAERKLALLTPLGIEVDDPALDFFVSEADEADFANRIRDWDIGSGPLIAVSPVSKRAYKVWPAQRFAHICDRLVEQYQAQIFFLIGPGETHFAEDVKKHMHYPSLPVDDSLSLYQAACLLDHAVCYVGNDNGLMHLSIARKTKTIAIFGRPRARNWASPLPIQIALEHDPGCKDHCCHPDCGLECLTGIKVEAVWDELKNILEPRR